MDSVDGRSAADHGIADAHLDLLLELERRSGERDPFGRYWLGPLRAGQVKLQICALFPLSVDRATLEVERQLDAFDAAGRDHPGEVLAVTSGEDLAAALASSKIGMVLSLEGTEVLAGDPSSFDPLWRRGVRVVGLTHNHRNSFACGVDAAGDSGLSERGHELVARLLDLGCVIDLAHASERTFADVLACSGSAPLLMSHAGCRAVNDIPRNLDDDQLLAISRRGGLIGVMALPFAVDPDSPTIDRLVDHIEHAVACAGIDHVGLGGDFLAQIASVLPDQDGIGPAIDGLSGPQHYPALLEALHRRGFDAAAVTKIACGNLLRLLAATLPTRP